MTFDFPGVLTFGKFAADISVTFLICLYTDAFFSEYVVHYSYYSLLKSSSEKEILFNEIEIRDFPFLLICYYHANFPLFYILSRTMQLTKKNIMVIIYTNFIWGAKNNGSAKYLKNKT